MSNTLNNLSEEAKIRLAYIEFYHKVNDVSLVCKTFNISRPTFYKWLKRYDPNNLHTLEDESKAPVKKRRSLLSPQKEKRIKKLRQDNMYLGKDKLQPLYEKEYGEDVSKHHIQYVIQKYGLYPSGKSKSSYSPLTVDNNDESSNSEMASMSDGNKVSLLDALKNAGLGVFVKRALLGVLIIMLLYGGIFAAYTIYKNIDNRKSVLSINSSSTSISGDVQDEDLVSKVGKLMDLPTSEEPTIATVTDRTQLDDHQFFSSAKNGDKILLYRKAKLAVLYDPIANKIISTAPIDLGE